MDIARLYKFLYNNVGQKVSFVEINVAAGTDLSDARWVTKIKELKPPGLEVTIDHGTHVWIDLTNPGGFEVAIRRDKRPKVKAKMGRALWNEILGDSAFDNPKNVNGGKQERIDEVFKKASARLGDMRQSGTLTLYVDAGSTTEKFIEQLDDLDDLLELKRKPSDADKSPSERRLLPRIQIVTSSIEIIDIVRQGRHRDSIEVYAIGGQVWPNYASMAGLMTQKSLKLYGRMFNNCVAIVGATGYRPESERGAASLLCSSIDEMITKDFFIRNSDFRVALFDSEKLKEPTVPRKFAPLSCVDLVVTDRGEEEIAETDKEKFKDLPEVVRAFRMDAASLNVATLVV